jgi:hypothetical protein
MARKRPCSCGLFNAIFDGSRLPYGREMSIAGQFIADLQLARRIGKVSSETEQHLKHELSATTSAG